MSTTFTITQTPTLANLILYPNAAIKTQMTPIGSANNYDCVDETYDVPDEDTTYVYTTSISRVTDIYGLPNHTTETGIINYVKIIGRAKSNLYTQSSLGEYKLLMSTSAVTYSSTDFDLTTDYTSYSYDWINCPATGIAWTWTDIDNMKIGAACSSPSIAGATQTVFRPNANGAVQEFADQYPASTSHYDKVDETTADDDSTYVYDNVAWTSGMTRTDSYVVANHTTESGTIDSVTVYCRAKKTLHYGTPGKTFEIYCGIYKGGLSYFGASADGTLNDDGSYSVYSHTFIVDPADSAAWTWTDIDNMEPEVKIKYTTGSGANYPCFTQIYAVVNHYALNVNPEIHTTQCYAVVNYIPSSSTCYLTYPSSYNFQHDREIGKINFWNMTRRTYDIQRNSKSVSMTGMETGSTATARLHCIEGMKDNGEQITISGMSDANLNTTWMIRDFKYNIEPSNPNIWNWDMSLEKV